MPTEHGADSTAAGRLGEMPDPDWAWSAYSPNDQWPWTLCRAAHLLRRAGFGFDWNQLQRALRKGPRPTVDRLLHGDDAGGFNRTYDEYESSVSGGDGADTLRAWWLRRMTETPQPLLEKMTLFWHGHFSVSHRRVEDAQLLRRHVQLLRRHALGSFRDLMHDIVHDPALLVSLDATANRRTQPSEFFARHLVETYTLGPGHATESDIRDTARAFTGQFVLRGNLRHFTREQDQGEKTIFGQRGKLDGSGAVDALLAHSATPRWVVRKLYRWLVSETDEPSDDLLDPLAKSFSEDYDIGQLVEMILRSNIFFSNRAYRRKTKSPIEFALGLVLALGGSVPTEPLAEDVAALGQRLYDPPTLNGWIGGTHWVDRAGMMRRAHLAAKMLSGEEPYRGQLDPLAVAQKLGADEPVAAARLLMGLVLQSDVDKQLRRALLQDVDAIAHVEDQQEVTQRFREFVLRMTSLPHYHLA